MRETGEKLPSHSTNEKISSFRRSRCRRRRRYGRKGRKVRRESEMRKNSCVTHSERTNERTNEQTNERLRPTVKDRVVKRHSVSNQCNFHQPHRLFSHYVPSPTAYNSPPSFKIIAFQTCLVTFAKDVCFPTAYG